MKNIITIILAIVIIAAGAYIAIEYFGLGLPDDNDGYDDPEEDTPDMYVVKVEGRVRASPVLIGETVFLVYIDNVYFQKEVSWWQGLEEWYKTLGLWTGDVKLVMSATVTESGQYIGTQTKTEYLDPILTPTTVGYADFGIVFDAISGEGFHEGDTIDLHYEVFEKISGNWKFMYEGDKTITGAAP